MEDTLSRQQQLCEQAFSAESAGRLQSAAADYRRALVLEKSNPTPYLYLGFVLNKMGDSRAAVSVYSLACDLSPKVLNAWRNPEVSKDIQLRSHNANELLRDHFTQLHKSTLAEYQRLYPMADIQRIYDAIWCATHDQEFQFKNVQQRPHLFYVPDLEASPVFDSSLYPWCHAIEAAFEEIREEYYQLAMNPGIVGEPYIDANASALGESWKPLIGSKNWTSHQLYKNDHADRILIEQLPTTCALLEQVPLLKTHGQPREVLFSVLLGKQQIPPHYGLANTDMTVHLPLIASSKAGMNVAGQEYLWQEGKAFLFDDSFLHESWNNSSEPRVNLLFGAWHPDLSAHEQNAVAASFESREAWNKTRSI
ncbi:MAG: aspartate beta-hydroxylase [Kiritimatiellia bacterium]|jgi:aspartate beta-hydroxylase